jgi:hypothetical protein
MIGFLPGKIALALLNFKLESWGKLSSAVFMGNSGNHSAHYSILGPHQF